ncbi:MAG TPA: hypothetical protein VFO34_13505 [Candidatus Acidoferrales bacterium]|nr:hypothetical protein [Candidatus Acidoferrales bacterium]
MRLSNLGGVGIVGMFAVALGAWLIWRHRADISSWMSAYFRELRAELKSRSSIPETMRRSDEMRSRLRAAHLPHGALAIVAGAALIVAGQLALFIDLLS